jgi:hypothetical protein
MQGQPGGAETAKFTVEQNKLALELHAEKARTRRDRWISAASARRRPARVGCRRLRGSAVCLSLS